MSIVTFLVPPCHPHSALMHRDHTWSLPLINPLSLCGATVQFSDGQRELEAQLQKFNQGLNFCGEHC